MLQLFCYTKSFLLKLYFTRKSSHWESWTRRQHKMFHIREATDLNLSFDCLIGDQKQNMWIQRSNTFYNLPRLSNNPVDPVAKHDKQNLSLTFDHVDTSGLCFLQCFCWKWHYIVKKVTYCRGGGLNQLRGFVLVEDRNLGWKFRLTLCLM